MFVALHTPTLARSLPSTTSNGSWVGALAARSHTTLHTIASAVLTPTRPPSYLPESPGDDSAPTALSPSPYLSQRLTQPHILHTRLSARRLHHRGRSPPMLLPLLAACLLHAHHLLCATTVHRLHSRPASALPTAIDNSPTCLTPYYYLYDCGSTISLLAADAATAAARALPNLRYHRLLSR
jgi:hypothetical protein